VSQTQVSTLIQISPSDVLVTHSATKQAIYDLAWSPDGKYIIAGSTDNLAQVFSVADGQYSLVPDSQRTAKTRTEADLCYRFLCTSDSGSLAFRAGCCLGPAERVSCYAKQ
jgi:WD40 repeat protein